MNVVVTSHLPVCLYSAAGKKVNRQDFYTGKTVARTHCTVGRKNQKVNLHGGTVPRSETVSFLDNELREGVFRTFGFLKPKRLFSRIKLVTKNDLAPRRGVETCSLAQVDPTGGCNSANRVSARDGKSSVHLASQGHYAGVFIGI
jgi:hypothetical protein